MKVVGVLRPDDPTVDTEAPSVPQNLSGTAASTSVIDLTWSASTDNIGVAGYTLFRDGAPLATTTSTSYQDSGLIEGQLYSYFVQAFDAAGNSSGSSLTEQVTTLTIQNDPPTWNFPNQTYTQNDAVSISLDSVCTDPEGDTLTYSASGLPTGVSLTGSRNETLTGTVSQAGTTNPVFTADDGTNTPVQVQVQFTVDALDTTAPAAPTGLTVTAKTAGSISLDWTDSPESDLAAAPYTVERSTDGTSYGVRASSVGTSSYVDSGLSANTQYWYRIRATDLASNTSDASSVVTDTTLDFSAGLYDYRKWGIPYHTDPVPSAIMPTLPTGADFTNHEWINNDPLARETPTPSGASNEWVMAYNGNDGSAGNNGQGTLAAPRRNPPQTGTYPAGTKFFFVGDNTPWPTSSSTNRKVDFTNWDNLDQNIGTFNGTSSNPCWFVGINKPRLALRRGTISGSHVIWREMGTDGQVTSNSRGSVQPQNMDYICFQDCKFFGRESSNGHNQINPANTNFILMYNCEIAYCGLWTSTNGSTPDWHGFRPSQATRWAWVVDCDIHNMSGDSIQSGISNGWTDPSLAPHYMYYAGGNFYGNRENCIDNKNSFHVMMVKNECHSNLEQSSAINGTLITVAQDNEGPSSGFHWCVGNTLYDGVVGMRYSGNRGGVNGWEQGFLINNVCRDNSLAGLYQAGNGTLGPGSERYRELTVVFNTTARCPTHFYSEIDADQSPIDVIGNVGYDVSTAYDVDNEPIFTYSHNTTFNPSGSVTTSGQLDSGTNNDLDTDPLMTDPGNNDFTLQAGSPAIAQVPEPSCFQLFEDMYGLNIRYDFNGNARPSSGNWDAGAFQRT